MPSTTANAITASPLGEINTTPLIDVLLVLLVMLILTIPAATHTLSVDLPSCTADCSAPPTDLLRNRVTLDAGERLLWNGSRSPARSLQPRWRRAAGCRSNPSCSSPPTPPPATMPPRTR